VAEHPLPRLRRYFPQRGKISLSLIFPLWGKWRAAPKGALFTSPHQSPKITIKTNPPQKVLPLSR
jgi:hypothetical protein